jgi:predicted small metal-binding protein
MPSFKCKDIGLKCEFEAIAENEAELERIIAEHAHMAHSLDPIPADMWRKIRSEIH